MVLRLGGRGPHQPRPAALLTLVPGLLRVRGLRQLRRDWGAGRGRGVRRLRGDGRAQAEARVQGLQQVRRVQRGGCSARRPRRGRKYSFDRSQGTASLPARPRHPPFPHSGTGQRSGRESSAAVRRNATCKLISQFALAAFVYAAAGGQVRGEGAAVTRGDTATLRQHSSHRTRAHPELTGGWRLLTQHSSQLRDT